MGRLSGVNRSEQKEEVLGVAVNALAAVAKYHGPVERTHVQWSGGVVSYILYDFLNDRSGVTFVQRPIKEWISDGYCHADIFSDIH